MASIIKRKTKYSVVYTYTDSNGAKRQKWETCGSHAEAKKRKAEIEHQLDTGVFIPPSADTLSDFLDEYVSLYGVNTWAPSTFDGHTALISNYIKPIIGDVKLDDINPRMITKFYKDLQTVKAVPRYGQPEGTYLPQYDTGDTQTPAERVQSGSKVGADGKESCSECHCSQSQEA